jgi:ATP-binding cassette subfamily F protein 3
LSGKSQPSGGNTAVPEPTKRKRKYPYRKVAEIEAEIHDREQAIARLHQELATPEVLRNGQLVVQMNRELEEHSATLEQLVEHWQEALELNG